MLGITQNSTQTEVLNEIRGLIDVRVRIEKSNWQNVKYVDFQKNLSKIQSETNYVVFGRRGSGKTSLLLTLYNEYLESEVLPIYLGCEMCKTYSYPNTLVFLLEKIVEEILKKPSLTFIFSKEKKELQGLLVELKKIHSEPDVREVEKLNESSRRDDSKLSAALPELGVEVGVGGAAEEKESKKYSDVIEKIKTLEQRLPDYQRIMENALRKLGKKSCFILFDDYYFISLNEQALVIDYFHRLCKDTRMFFKVATVRHRSKLYHRDSVSIRGIQEGMDFQSIDLDYSLAEIKKAEEFMRSIILDLENQLGQDAVQRLFVTGEGGFNRMVWASGGVPRDFLNILRYCIDSLISGQSERIGKREIDLAAHKYYLDKLAAEFSSSYYSKGDSQQLLNNLLIWCLDINEKTGFFVRPSDYETHPNLKDLIDLRLIHLAAKGTTSKSKSGEIFDGYILDVGSYSNRLGLRTNTLGEINILRTFERKGESEFRSIAPILDWDSVNRAEELRKAKILAGPNQTTLSDIQ